MKSEIKCHKPPLRLAIEAIAVIVIGLVLSALTIVNVQRWLWLTLLVSLSFLAFEVLALAMLLKNAPLIIMDKGTLRIKCKRRAPEAPFARRRRLEIPLGGIERVWIGKPIDYASGVLLQGFESRGYPYENTMLFWIKGDPEPHQMREFSWLTNTTQLLEAIESANIPIERKQDAVKA